MDILSRRLKREQDARAEATRRFGRTPNALHILQALVDSSPGPQYREWIDRLVIFYAAQTALEEYREGPRDISLDGKIHD